MSSSLSTPNAFSAVQVAALAEMSRPRQLGIMGSLYALGAAAGHVAGTPVPVEALVVGGLLLLVAGASINYVNEYADVESDRRADRTAFSGGSGALVERDLSPEFGLQAAVATLAVCSGLTALSVTSGLLSPAAGTALAVFLLLGWQYSVPPAAFAWRGLGELDNAVAGGLVLPLYGAAVVTGDIDVGQVAAFLPTTAFLFLTLLATTWPDRQADARAGKATLATRLHPRQMRVLYAVWLGVAVVLVAGLPQAVLPTPTVAALVVTLPAFAYGFHRYTRQHSPTPTVLAMVVAVCLQAAGWLAV